MNQILEQYLRVYCNYQQENWSKLLPLTEFAYNNTPSATTSVSLLFANKGYYLNITVYSEHDIASSQACRKLNCFLGVGNNILKEDNLADKAIRDVFVLFWEAMTLLVVEALPCFQK